VVAGARAAAADLRRARGETEAVSAVAPERLARAGDAIAAAERLLKACRMYQSGAPAVARFAAETADALAAYATLHGALALRLGPRGLSLEGAALTETGSSADNPWYALFRDGVRELRIEPGAEAGELERFADAVTQLAKPGHGDERDAPEDDAVTLLWALALERVRIRAGPALRDPEDAIELAARIEDERRAVRELSARAAFALVGAGPEPASPPLESRELEFLDRENLASLAPVPPEVVAERGDLFALTNAERLLLADLVATDDPALVPRAVAALTAAWLDGDGGDAIARRIADQLESALVAGAIADATAIAQAIDGAVAGAASANTLDPGRLSALLEVLEATDLCRLIAAAHADAHGDRPRHRAVLTLMQTLPPPLLDPLANARATIADAPARIAFERDVAAARSTSRRHSAVRAPRPTSGPEAAPAPARAPSQRPPALGAALPGGGEPTPSTRPPLRPTGAPGGPDMPAVAAAGAPERPPPRTSAAALARADDDPRRARSLHESLGFHISTPRSREDVFTDADGHAASDSDGGGADPEGSSRE
jgi:hypothetical protein